MKADSSATIPLQTDPRWQLVQRIAASPGFVNSPRLSTFLLYVSRQTLSGEGGCLNERCIGEEVFERSPDYDTRDDNIVRSHASRLRLRLQDYFDGEGASEQLRVNIPRGSYVPLFEPSASAASAPALEAPSSEFAFPDHESASASPPSSPRRVTSTFLVVCLVLLAAAIAAVFTSVYLRFPGTIEQTASHKLWSQMFHRDRQTIIVPADSSLVIAKLLIGHPVRLSDYADGRYRQENLCDKPCDQRMVQTVEALRYTSMSDLEFAVKVTHIPEAIPDRTEIRYARDLELKDFKESNLVLAGSQEADPWLAVVSPQMNFVVHDDPSIGSLYVENRQPKAGEKSAYPYDGHDPQHRGLATIAFLPNLSGNGNLLIVQGFTLAGTQAAAEFVTNKQEFDAFFPSYSGNPSRLPHFEILLSTVEINGMASRPIPLAWHIYP
ncbi:MAG: hypothetical protein ABSD20_20345 [Terriglobales bacterium]